MSITMQSVLIPAGLSPSGVSNWNNHIGITSGNPHGVTAGMLGLGTSDSPTFGGLAVNSTGTTQLLADFQVGGASKARIDHGGMLTATGSTCGGFYSSNSYGYMTNFGNTRYAFSSTGANAALQLVTAGTTRVSVDGTSGVVGINTALGSIAGQLHVTNSNINNPTLVIQAISGQIGNQTSWRNPSGAENAYVDINGYAKFGGVSLQASSVYAFGIADPMGGGYSKIYSGGVSKWIKANTDAIDRAQIDSSGMWLMGAQGVHALGLGDPTANGSWRIVGDGANLLIQKLVSGTWITKSTITG